MRKKNGFIATSLIYSFFIVFVALTSTILLTYSYYRNLLNNLNRGVLENLNEKIDSKYTLLTNLISGGDVDFDISKWHTVYAERVTSGYNYGAYGDGSSSSGTYSFRLNMSYNNIPNQNASITQENITPLTTSANRKLYFRMRIFRNGNINFQNNYNDANVILTDGSNTYKGTSIAGGFSNWEVYSFIINLNPQTNAWTLKIFANNQNKLNSDYVSIFVDDIMLVDVTEVASKTNWNDVILKNNLDGTNGLKYKLDYFTGNYSYATS